VQTWAQMLVMSLTQQQPLLAQKNQLALQTLWAANADNENR
jgi:hypothetical protein